MTIKNQDKQIGESALHTNWLHRLKKLMRFQSSAKPVKETNTELNKYKLVLEQAPGSVCIMDKHMNFEYINPCFTQLSGYTKEDLLHKNIQDTLYRGTIPESRTEVSEALRKGEKWQGELLTYHKSGKPYWANTIAAPYKDESGNIEGYIIIQQDITQHKNMEVSLRESEDLYRTLIEKSLDGVVITQNAKMILVNNAFCEMLGYTREEILQFNAPDLLVPEDRERVLDIHYKRMRGEIEKLNYTTKFLHKNGSTITVEMNAATVKVNGQIASFTTMRDITRRLAMEQTLQESEERYKTLVENSQDCITIIRDNKFLFANNTYCKMLHYTPEELYNMPAINTLHPGEREKALKVLERRRNGDFSTINDVMLFLTKEGEIKECETTSTMIEYDGEWASFYTSHDITESKRLQQKIQESEAQYRNLVEKALDGISISQDGILKFVNKAFCDILGYSPEELMNKKAIDYIAPEYHERMFAMYKQRMTGDLLKTIYSCEVITKNNERRNVEMNITTIDFQGQPAAFIITRDITERIQMQEALRRSEQKYRELTEMLPQAVYELDAQGKPTYMNMAGLKAFGLEKGIKIDKAFDLFIPEDRQRMNKALKEEAARIITDNCCTHSEPSEPIEYTAKRIDGTTFPVIIYGTSIVEDCKVVGSRGIIVDISERKAMENALRDSEEKYRSLIEKATDGIVITQDGLLKFANKAMCEILGYPWDEITNIPFLQLVVEEEKQVMIDYHKRRMAGENFTSLYRSRIIRKDKTIVTVELNSRTIDYFGKPAAFIIIRDITERIQIEEELRLAKQNLELLNLDLEQRVKESSESLTEARTQLINLQKENLQSQFDVLRQQVNPHFLFNSLNVLTSLIKLEPDLAEKFSEHLSKVYRYVLENKDNELVDLNTELNFLDAYIFLLNIRFVGKLKVNINIPDARRNDQLIPLAMQLLIENAIKHNIMSKTEPLIIDIFIDKENFLNIVNNLQERPSQLVSTGVGLKNIQNRYLLLNNTQPVFEKTNTHFIAKVPLVRID